ncbi:hypothetical protein DOTSEDRAFT_34110 [Dothistroma septosporum NZE10]|uniref:Uncharacterized protein n=1 Tax=Dothistroma septosporum (strain NZE10 / CBS 128990) TaxID=675120 RepID=N1PQC5_DOTSN|nr:hypothetical protein DOTSEDRAFT_34110 [Dothistroma septosporum NZE10]
MCLGCSGNNCNGAAGAIQEVTAKGRCLEASGRHSYRVSACYEMSQVRNHVSEPHPSRAKVTNFNIPTEPYTEKGTTVVRLEAKELAQSDRAVAKLPLPWRKLGHNVNTRFSWGNFEVQQFLSKQQIEKHRCR